MAKKDKKNNTENKPESTPENTSENTSENATENNSEPTPEVETPAKKVENIIPDVTPKSAFTKALYSNDGKFVLVSNGIQLCSYLNKPNIVTFDTHFELNGIRYSYNGIEIKHI